MSRIVICLRNLWYLRLHAPTMERLLQNGHEVHLTIIGDDRLGNDPVKLRGAHRHLDDLVARYPNLRFHAIARSLNRWAVLDMMIGRLIDFFHFRRRFYDGREILRQRAKGPPPLRTLLAWRIWCSPWVIAAACRLLPFLERCLPPEMGTYQLLAKIRPDLVAFSPLMDLALPQFSQVRAARALRINTALLVNSWDNLSSKAWLRECPDRTIVWNEIQAGEAINIHGVARSNITVTGCPSFDDLFGFRPTLSRQEFCGKAGLSSDRPFILYVCSSLFGEPGQHESDFVRAWISALRSHPDQALATAQVVVRVHPKRTKNWENAVRELEGSAVFFPREAMFPVLADERSDYFHSIWYADAVVGLNTSAFWEAAAVEKPIFAVLDPAYAEHQTKTVHFDYLMDGGRGVLRTAPDLAGHLYQVAKALRGEAPQTEIERAEVTKFLRPRGRDKSVAGILAEALEQQAREPAEIRPTGIHAKIVRWALLPIADLAWRMYNSDRRLRRTMMIDETFAKAGHPSAAREAKRRPKVGKIDHSGKRAKRARQYEQSRAQT